MICKTDIDFTNIDSKVKTRLSIVLTFSNMASASTIKYPEYLKLDQEWADFFYDQTTQEILLPILAQLSTVPKFYPDKDDIFRCFYLTPFEEIKVILIGQDPYHNGCATGLSFDVKLGHQMSPSLQNIYKELETEDYFPTKDGDLSRWAKQGVLLLNTALTVAPGSPDSHTDMWRPFFDHLMKYLMTRNDVVWLLLGKKAIDYKLDIVMSNDTHEIVESTHPSPLSAYRAAGSTPAFIGSKVFRKVNEELKKKNLKQIVW